MTSAPAGFSRFLHCLELLDASGGDVYLAQALPALRDCAAVAGVAAWIVDPRTDGVRPVGHCGSHDSDLYLRQLSSAVIRTVVDNADGDLLQHGLEAVAVDLADVGRLVIVAKLCPGARAQTTKPLLQVLVRMLVFGRPERTQQTAGRHAALARAARTLFASLDFEEMTRCVCIEASRLAGAELAVLFRLHEDELEIVGVSGHGPELVGLTIPSTIGMPGAVLASATGMLANNYQETFDVPPSMQQHYVRSAVAVPLAWNGHAGVLELGYERPGAATTNDLELLEAFAELANAALANAEAYAGVSQAALTDRLTGCLNPAGLHDRLHRELTVVQPDPSVVSVVLLDLNGFKQVNDQHGHAVGDELLRRVGHELRRCVRDGDAVARWGGDEFVLVVAGADEGVAMDVGDRAIKGITRITRELIGAQAGAAAVAGVAAHAAGQTIEELFVEADRALYVSKQDRAAGSCIRASEVPADFMPSDPSQRVFDAEPASTASSVAVSSDALLDRLRQRSQQLALATKLGTSLAGLDDVQEIVDAVVADLRESFGYYACCITRLRPDDWVELVAWQGGIEIDDAPICRSWRQRKDEGLIGRCLQLDSPVLVNDVRADAAYLDNANLGETRSEVGVPIRVNDRAWGVLNVLESRVDAFDEDDVRLFEWLGHHLGVVLAAAYRRSAIPAHSWPDEGLEAA